MSSKVIFACLLIASASAVPAHNGYAYKQGVSGHIGLGGSSINEINYAPGASNIVRTSTVQSQYVQPQVSTVTTNYGQGSSHGSYGHSGSVNVGGHGQASSVVSHSTRGGQSSGYVFQGFPEAPNPLDVGVPYVRSAGNGYVEEQGAGFGAPIITKSFHTYSGPEEHDEKTAVHHINIGTPQKHFRVIYVKNPSSSSNRALIKAHVAPKEEKTVVYVLSKNQNELNVETEIDEPAPTQPSKPDVVFVKYQNQEEIAHLQDSVQAQYNAIPGVNQVVDEGLAPVRSVVGTVGGQGESYSQGAGFGSASGVSNTYTHGPGVGGGNSYTQSSHSYSSGAPTTFTSGNYGSASQTVHHVGGNVPSVYLPSSL